MLPSNSFRVRRAFTFVDLLTVVAILTLIVSLLFSLGSRQKMIKDTEFCESNLKKISTAMLMYRNDYDEQMPPVAYPSGKYTMPNRSIGKSLLWNHLLDPYVKDRNVFNCPNNKYSKPILPYDGQFVESFGYGINPAVNGIADASISRVSDLITISGGRYYMVSPFNSDIPNPDATGPCGAIPTAPMYPIHRNGNILYPSGLVTVAYYDGHIARIDPRTVYDASAAGYQACAGFNGKQEAWNPSAP